MGFSVKPAQATSRPTGYEIVSLALA